MNQPCKDFWNGRRVLITGHTGFKGSWSSIWLKDLGANVCGVALEPHTYPSLFKEANLNEKIKSAFIDIRDFDRLARVFEEFQPEIVFHMAAQPLVRHSYSDPIATFETNVMGTVNVLEACRQQSSVRVVVNVTTDKVYENMEWDHPYKENDRLGGHDPYSSSKACSELVSASYNRSFFVTDNQIAHATVRAGNVIGGGDWSTDRLIPDLLRFILSGKAIELRNPDAIRPWQHVIEPISGYLLLAERLWLEPNKYIGNWNFGPHEVDARTVKWITQYLSKQLDSKADWVEQPGNHPHETNTLKLDIAKAIAHLSWRPIWDIEQALDKIIEWQKCWQAGEDVHSICIKQIRCYTEQGKMNV